MANDPLDEYFDSTSRRVHSSPRKLANVVRAAYPIGVPALIMNQYRSFWRSSRLLIPSWNP